MAVTAQAYKLVIDGHEVAAAAGRVAVVTSPATGEPVASVPVADEQDVDRAVRSARRAFEEGPWPKMAASERGRVLLRIGALLREGVGGLALVGVPSGGRVIGDARGDG